VSDVIGFDIGYCFVVDRTSLKSPLPGRLAWWVVLGVLVTFQTLGPANRPLLDLSNLQVTLHPDTPVLKTEYN
jgi:hypothetical protein